MAIQSVLIITLLSCFEQVFTHHASVNIHLDLSAQISDDSNRLTEEMTRVCMEEIQLSIVEVKKFKSNQSHDNEPDEAIQCFAHCIYEQLGVMKDGIFVNNDLSQKLVLPPDVNGENSDYSMCRSIRGSNKCDTAYKIHLCIQKVKFSAETRDQPQSSAQPLYVDGNSYHNDNGDDEPVDNSNGQ